MDNRRLGFLSPTLMLVIALGVMTLVAGVNWKLYRSKAAELTSYKLAVKTASDAAEAERKRQQTAREKVDAERQKSADKRVADIRARWLRERNGSAGQAKPVPTAATICNDASDNQRLSQAVDRFKSGVRPLLEQCEVQTGQLIELQGWAVEQGAVR